MKGCFGNSHPGMTISEGGLWLPQLGKAGTAKSHKMSVLMRFQPCHACVLMQFLEKDVGVGGERKLWKKMLLGNFQMPSTHQ